MITQKKQQPRGIRNNNPLNMVRTRRSKWVGMRPQQTDKMFCFNAMCRVENGCSLASDDITLGYSLFIQYLHKDQYNAF